MNHTTVLIVGAGPVGLTLGCELARRNISFRIIEGLPVPPQGSRAKALQPRSLEILNDLGIAGPLMEEGYTDLPYRKFYGQQLTGDVPRNIFQRDDTRYPRVLLLPQYKVEDRLRGKLEELGGKIEWATTLDDFTLTDKGVSCKLEHPNWTEEINCVYMVACDGGKGTTRKKLGINFVGETHQQEQLWVGDVELEGLKPDAWYNWLSPEFGLAFALFPFKDSNNWQLQAVVLPDAAGKTPEPTLDGFNKLFVERTGMTGVTFTNSTWQSIYRVNIRMADKYRVGNVFIAGDACHVHSIAGGMGMNTGIQDAYNLGWKLAAVIHGTAGEQLLDTYAEERIPIADLLLSTTTEKQRALLNAATTGKGGFDKLASKDTTQLDLHYHDSSLTIKGNSPGTALQAGDRAPDVELTDGSWLSDQLNGREWKLLLFGNASFAGNQQVKIIYAKDEKLMKAYGCEDGLVLIRPDGYIALFATDAAMVDSYFEQMR